MGGGGPLFWLLGQRRKVHHQRPEAVKNPKMEESIVFSHQVSNDTRSITFAHFISPYKMCHYKDFWPTQQLIVAGAGMPQSKKGNIPNSTRAAFIYSDNWDDHSWIYQLHHWAISNQLPSTKNVRTSSDLNASSNFSKLRKRGGGRKKERKKGRKKKKRRKKWLTKIFQWFS